LGLGTSTLTSTHRHGKVLVASLPIGRSICSSKAAAPMPGRTQVARQLQRPQRKSR
jgi:hypothetical protein